MDPPDRVVIRLEAGDGQDTLSQVSRDAFGVDRQRQLQRPAEAAMAALDAVKLLARGFAFTAHPGDSQASLVVLQLHIVLGQSGQFDHDDVAVRRLEHVDRRCPPRGSRREAGHPLLYSDQVLERIPAYESHEWIVPRHVGIRDSGLGARGSGLGIRGSGFGARDSGLGARERERLFRIPDPEPKSESRIPDPESRVTVSRCATIERFYRRYLWLLYKQRDSKRACWSRWSRTCSASSSSSTSPRAICAASSV